MPVEILELERDCTVTLTRRLREALGIEPGDLLLAEAGHGRLLVTPVEERLQQILGDVDRRELKEMAQTNLLEESSRSAEAKAQF